MTSQARRRLPIGVRSFREIREGDYYYVDKTAFLRDLLDGGKHYFLSRPSGFGKSLFLDTCKALFEGSRSWFRDLDIHAEWDWTVRHPVVRLSLAGGTYTQPDDLDRILTAQFGGIERQWDVTAGHSLLSARFAGLIEAVSRKVGRSVVVLVDDYDRPVLDVIETPSKARANLNRLMGVFSMIKEMGASVRFSLVTGVTNLARGSLFSGLNNLIDVTLEPQYSAICGYTEDDLENVFGPELVGLDRDMIRDRYFGYQWLGEAVYSPLDVLKLLRHRRFRAYWFEDSSCASLLDTLASRRVGSAELDGMLADGALLSGLDVDDVATETLAFQAGYLTISEEMSLSGIYRLCFPNREVRKSLEELLG